jgi:HK97 family phage major capsid protein
MARAFSYKIDDDWINGDGSAGDGSFRGILNHMNQKEHEASQVPLSHVTFDTLDMADYAQIVAACPAYALPNAKWIVSQVGFSSSMLRLAATAGGNTIQSIQGGMGLSFLGFPVVISQVMPSTRTTLVNNPMVLFGDPSLGSILGIRRGIEVVVDRSRYLEFDCTAIRATLRVAMESEAACGTDSVAGPLVCGFGCASAYSGFSGFSGIVND